MDFLLAGKIVNTHGLTGEVKILPYTDEPTVFDGFTEVYIKQKDGMFPLTIKKVRYHKRCALVLFDGFDISLAEKHKGIMV